MQVRCGREELQARIEQFCQERRAILDRENVQEFCGVAGTAGCARTTAALTRQASSNSHLRHSLACNLVGPAIPAATTVKLEPGSEVTAGPLDTRLSELENRAVLAGSTPVPADVYARIKVLEDRLELLESLSETSDNPKRVLKDLDEKQNEAKKMQERRARAQNNLKIIDERIENLKCTLKSERTTKIKL